MGDDRNILFDASLVQQFNLCPFIVLIGPGVESQGRIYLDPGKEVIEIFPGGRIALLSGYLGDVEVDGTHFLKKLIPAGLWSIIFKSGEVFFKNPFDLL